MSAQGNVIAVPCGAGPSSVGRTAAGWLPRKWSGARFMCQPHGVAPGGSFGREVMRQPERGEAAEAEAGGVLAVDELVGPGVGAKGQQAGGVGDPAAVVGDGDLVGGVGGGRRGVGDGDVDAGGVGPPAVLEELGEHEPEGGVAEAG